MMGLEQIRRANQEIRIPWELWSRWVGDRRIELRRADFRHPEMGLWSLPSQSVDHCITDPPYSESTHSKHRVGASLPDGDERRGRAYNRMGRACSSRAKALGFGHLTPQVRLACAFHLARVVRRWVIVFSDFEGVDGWKRDLEAAGLDYVRTAVWRKRNATPQFSGDRPAVGAEAIVIAHQPGRKSWNGRGAHGVWEHSVVRNRSGAHPRLHTTQKPLALMVDLVRLFTNVGETVIDPFAGSGTTGLACLYSGRGFIGWERLKRHAETARDRLGLP